MTRRESDHDVEKKKVENVQLIPVASEADTSSHLKEISAVLKVEEKWNDLVKIIVVVIFSQ